MRRYFNGICAVIVFLHAPALVADDTATEKARVQVPYNGQQRPTASSRAGLEPQSTGQVVVIHIDNTGVSDWTYVNPRTPSLVPPRTGIQFRNDTADRTFTVSIPVTLKLADPAAKLAVLNRDPQLAYQRALRLQYALAADANPAGHWPEETQPVAFTTANALIEEIDSLLRVREIVGAADPAPADLDAIANYYIALKNVAGSTDTAIPAADRNSDLPAETKLPSSLKALTDRVAALLARYGALLRRERQIEPPPTAGTNVGPEVARKNLADAYSELAALYKQIADDSSRETRLRPRIDELMMRINAARVAINGTPQPPPVGTRIDKEADAVRREEAAIHEELVRFAGDRPRAIGAFAELNADLAQPLLDGTFPSSAGRPARAKALTVESLDKEIQALLDSRQSSVDQRVKDLLTEDLRQRRRAKTWLSESNRERARDLDASIDLRKQTLADLGRQGKTDDEDALRARFSTVGISQCTRDDTNLTCFATQLVPPNATAIFSDDFVEAALPSGVVFKFSIGFFDEVGTPSNATVYLTKTEKPKPPPNAFTWSLVGGVGQKRDPAIDQSKLAKDASGNPTGATIFPACGDPVCSQGHKNHFNGLGQVQLTQNIADYFVGSGTVSFKSGDIGVSQPGTTTDQNATFSQYRFSVFSDAGWLLDFGRMTFAQPSNGISIVEGGEGFRIVYAPRSISGTYIVKRESEKFAANRPNLDQWSAVVQASNIPLQTGGPFRAITLTFATGADSHPSTVDAANGARRRSGYSYRNYGFDVSYAIPLIHVNGNLGSYANERNADDSSTICTLAPDKARCDGSGAATLLTMTRSFGLSEKNVPARLVTVTFARGSSDNPTTPTKDEGYVGDGGGFAPDVIFLSTLLSPINTSIVTNDPYPALRIGSGIANKQYLGVQYVETSFSPLYTLAQAFSIHDIASFSTTFRYHEYRLRRQFAGARGAGHEYDLESLIEGPKGVKTTLGAAYYRPGPAVHDFVKKNLWSLYSKVSISFGQ